MQLTRLLREHAKLRSLGAELVTLVAAPEPCDLEVLASKRWELARLVHQHLAYEERQLFQRLQGEADPAIQAAAVRGRRSIEQLHSVYKAHVERWKTPDVAADWPQFQVAATTMVRRMMVQLDREESELFPLIKNEPELPRQWHASVRNWAGEGVAMQPLLSSSPAESSQSVTKRPSLIGDGLRR